jgi:hypothetical protein
MLPAGEVPGEPSMLWDLVFLFGGLGVTGWAMGRGRLVGVSSVPALYSAPRLTPDRGVESPDISDCRFRGPLDLKR